MSEWKNVLWEDPEEGQLYDVYSKYGRRFINYKYKDGKWISEIDGSWLSIGITHFMIPPKPPED